MKIQITIEPGKFTGKIIDWIQGHRRTTLMFLLSLVLVGWVALYTEPITKPYTFSNGGVVSASEINANFDTLYTKVNNIASTMLRFPDGLEGTPINDTSYTVPAGKTLYVLSVGSSGSLQISSKSICNYTHSSCIIKEGTSFTNSSGTRFSGILVDAVTTIINNTSGSYTVPTGKTLFVVSLAVTSPPANAYLAVSSNNIYNNTSSNVGVFPAGTVITWSSGDYMTGYLK